MNKIFFLYLLNLTSFAQQINLAHNYKMKLDSCSSKIVCKGYLNYLKGYDFLYSNNKDGSDEQYNSLNALGLYSFVRERDSIETANKKVMFKLNYSHDDTIALESILSKVQNKSILILNENHTRLETRVFNYNMLPLLKKHNFTHLAMEALDNTLDFGVVSFKNGYYFIEPLQAEILRKARELGFQIVKYDSFIIDPVMRDSIQAYNLNDYIKSNDKIKMVVISGHSHGADDCEICPPLMGKVLKEKYHIDPITIDQTIGIDFPNCFDVNFEGKIKNCFLKSDVVKGKIGFGIFDYFYIHPISNNTRNWYLKMFDKKIYSIKSKLKNPALVQIYYKYEFEKDNGTYCTPLENITSIKKDGDLELLLTPKENYVVIYRDFKNKILKKQAFYSY